MATRNGIHVIWHTGQSNAHGNKPGEAVNTPEVDYYDTLLGETDPMPSTAFHPLHGTGATTGHVDGENHGSDATIGKILHAAGYKVVLINLSRGSTFAYSWIPADPERGVVEGNTWAPWVSESANAWALLQALYPDASFQHVHVRDQGTSDMRLPTTAGYPEIVARWAEDTQIVHDSLEALVGASVPKICWMSTILLTQSGTSGPVANWVNEIRAQQEAWCPAQWRIYADDNNVVEYDSAEYTHLTGPGYAQMGELIAAKFQELFPMGTLGTYAKNKLLDHELNQAAHTPDVEYYVHLRSGGSGLTALGAGANGYASLVIDNDTTTWPAPSSREVANGIAFTWDSPSDDWPDVDEVWITTSATEGAGELIASDTFDPIEVTPETGPFEIGVGDFVVTAPAGGFVDTVVHRMLGLMFGGTTYVATATQYISYWAGDPQGAGAQAGARVAMTMATQFDVASNGIASNSATIALTQQATGTFIAVHDAAAAGSLIYSASRLATVGATGTILVGQLRVKLT
jgi:hypothetical protein